MNKRWILPVAGDEAGEGVRAALDMGMPYPLAAILAQRYRSAGDIENFLTPRLRNLIAPEELPGVVEAVDLLVQALEKKRQILIYGDYDVDGVCSVALLERVLRALGGRVKHFLPHRMDDGYGLTASGVGHCCQEHEFEVLVACDCGTNSVDEIAGLRERGIEVLVLDHHEPKGAIPETVIVNPKCQADSPFRNLCSAGVVFKVVHGLLKRLGKHKEIALRDYLDLVAIATLADIVPLVGENRIFTYFGLQVLPTTRWAGLRALLGVAQVVAPVRGGDVAFRISPRLNAAGRVGTAQAALDLLLADDAAEAMRIARSLDKQNQERQGIELEVRGQIEAVLRGKFDPTRDFSIVVGGQGWHSGVLGIAAARFMREFHRPTIVVGFDEEGMGHGSGRSIEGFPLVQALGDCAGLLERFGGHEMAAGVSVRQEKFEEFQKTFEQAAQARLGLDELVPMLHLDAEMQMADISQETVCALERIEPFGCGNAQPCFFIRSISPVSEPRVVKDKHLQISFGKKKQPVHAVFFHTKRTDLPSPPWDVAFSLERNTYGGRDEVQMRIIAIRKG